MLTLVPGTQKKKKCKPSLDFHTDLRTLEAKNKVEVNIPISPRCSRAQVWRRAIVDHLLHLGGIYSAVVGTHTHGKLVEEYEYVYIPQLQPHHSQNTSPTLSILQQKEQEHKYTNKNKNKPNQNGETMLQRWKGSGNLARIAVVFLLSLFYGCTKALCWVFTLFFFFFFYPLTIFVI